MSMSTHIRDREHKKFEEDLDGETTVRVTPKTRGAMPTLADVMALFNPMVIPLKKFTRVKEIAGDAFYFINENFVQYRIKTHSLLPYDTELEENNILLLSGDVALDLGIVTAPDDLGMTTTFLGLE